MEYNTSILGQSPSEYLIRIIQKYIDGWVVNFEEDPNSQLKNQKIQIPKVRLVVGFANGWAGDGKFLLVEPK